MLLSSTAKIVCNEVTGSGTVASLTISNQHNKMQNNKELDSYFRSVGVVPGLVRILKMHKTQPAKKTLPFLS